MNFIKKLKTYYPKNEDLARTICFKNQIIEVFESFRQSIEIKVEDAKLTIRCPHRISDLKLQSFLDKKKSWINKDYILKNILFYNERQIKKYGLLTNFSFINSKIETCLI